MQAWQNVLVINEQSAHNGRAGHVIRVEKVDGGQLIQVELDEQGDQGQPNYKPKEIVPFLAEELRILG